ncbi:uncharacterized protein LOC116213100 [Punica granatum]|uniref:Uncharacterized protein n=2 Tax=Punica granatum TaxID=22663 RepID=A0A2I0L0A3_PUNGR|nr:uncharacterized protein LOC116213100 [Punica granatum]PKI74164.1 hypothetical protein CRG98_005402 [Punica granatum]
MASEMMSSDSATEHRTGVVNGTSASVPEDDCSSIVELAGDQELGTGSKSCCLGGALVSEEKIAQMGPSSGSEAESGFQEPEDICGVVVSNEERGEMEQPLRSSSNFGDFLGSGGNTVAGDVGRIDGCDGADRLLEVRKKQLLDELEGGSIFRGIGPLEHPDERVMILPHVDGQKFVKGVDAYLRSSLKVEVIDDTAVIEPIMIGPGTGNAKKKNIPKEDLEGKKSKRAKKRGKGGKPGSEKVEGSARLAWNSKDGTKRMYSSEEMEALRFVGVVEQRKLWREIYNGLGSVVAKEYSSLTAQKSQQQQGKSISEASNPLRRSHGRGILGEDSSKEDGAKLDKWGGKEAANANPSRPARGQSVSCDYDSTNLEEEDGDEDSEDSDEYYANIQRPAFAVEGEPNFEAGPPEDGLEYLRRVRWEAAQIPNVKVAKLDRSKLNKEQSVYMPVIPEIAKCPEHLMPSKQWEDEFLADFSKLRMAFLQAEASKVGASDKSQLKFVLGNKNFSSHLSAIGNFDNAEAEEERQTTSTTETPSPKVLKIDSASGSPTLSMLLSMDSVSRVSSLRKRISALEATNVLSRDDCLWIFALCAAVDTPLHADTCASLRSLLRKCATLRAQKEEVDDETIMLNILATISGRFFGQSDM